MLEFNSRLKFLKFNKKKYTKTLDHVMGQIIREAAREWLRAVLTSVPARGGFPVWTGAAKSTLQPLGRVLRIAVPINPVAKPNPRNNTTNEFKIEDRNFKYSFEWSTELVHFYINNFYPTFIKHTPWHSIEQGKQAFIVHVRETLKRRRPSWLQYIDVRTT